MNLETFVTWSLPGGFVLLALAESLARGRAFPEMPWWRIKGVLWFAVSYLASSLVPIYLDPFLSPYTLLDLTSLPQFVQIVLGFLAFEFLLYGWHRALHQVPVLWRLHQTHHSVERVDIWSAWHFHPLDIMGLTAVGSVALVLVLGIELEPALWITFIANTLGMFQHANLRTPAWLGYFVIRPEQHQMHHERGVHTGNFADIALFDMLFGTWRNDAEFEGDVGIVEDGSRRLVSLLRGARLD